MASWLDALARTRRQITDVFSRMVNSSGERDDFDPEEAEGWLLRADVPVRLTDHLLQELAAAPRSGVSRKEVLRHTLLGACGTPAPVDWQAAEPPRVVLVLGVNGSGKTTTCAKLAHLVAGLGLRPMLGAADTFRAAGSEQLKVWGERLGYDVVGGAQGADAASVAYDALDSAMARGSDVLLLDTAGRMHTRLPLMEELTKLQRAVAKRKPGAPDDTWIVLDGSMGHNAVTQAKVFNEAIPLTGVIVTKLDGSSKGGFVLSIAKELGIPVRFVGLGEAEEDLVPFDPSAFVDALLGLETVSEGQHG